METQLVAFRKLDGSHTGVNIAQNFIRIMREIDCLNNIAMITMDNAGNNQTMMVELESQLRRLNIPFEREGNRVRCFPHVINLAVKAGLKRLTSVDFDISDIEDRISEHFGNNSDEYDIELTVDSEYMDALEGDIVGKVRKFVTAVRASGLRRAQFRAILIAGNKAGGWGPERKRIQIVGLLKDVDTRWSSVFLMLERFLETYEVSQKIIEENDDLAQYEFSDAEIQVARDVKSFLQLFHCIQQIVSAEKTPTLAIVLPLYEELISMLKKAAQTKLKKLSHAIDASVKKLQEYLDISRKTKMYALAMVLHPKMKLKWLSENWTTSDFNTAEDAITNTLIEYEKSTRRVSVIRTDVPESVRRMLVRSDTVPAPVSAQESAYDSFEQLGSSFSEPAINTASGSAVPPNQAENPEDLERQADINGRKIVEAELEAYKNAGCVKATSMVDLLRFWRVNQHLYPLLYQVALDVLPVQASAVACERVFSSSKETDTNRRASMGPIKIEQLQLLKFSYRQDRLSFTQDLLYTERELSVLDIEPSVIEDLIRQGEVSRLDKLVADSWKGWGEVETE